MFLLNWQMIWTFLFYRVWYCILYRTENKLFYFYFYLLIHKCRWHWWQIFLRYHWHRWQICHPCRWYQWCTLTCKYLCKFSKKFETVLMEYSGAGGKLIHQKNKKQKISWHCPFNNTEYEAISHRWLCTPSFLNPLIYEKYFLFFFNSLLFVQHNKNKVRFLL